MIRHSKNNIGLQFKGKDQAFLYHATIWHILSDNEKLQKCQDNWPTLSELLNSIRSTNVRRPLNHIRRIREQLLRMNKLAAWRACTILIFGFCILRSLQIYSKKIRLLLQMLNVIENSFPSDKFCKKVQSCSNLNPIFIWSNILRWDIRPIRRSKILDCRRPPTAQTVILKTIAILLSLCALYL